MITAPLSAQMQLNFALITRGSFLYIAVVVIGKDRPQAVSATEASSVYLLVHGLDVVHELIVPCSENVLLCRYLSTSSTFAGFYIPID